MRLAAALYDRLLAQQLLLLDTRENKMWKYARVVAVIAALLFFMWANVAVTLWLAQHGTFQQAFDHFIMTLFTDWMLLLILTDAGVFTLMALVWLGRDMRRRGIPAAQWWAWMGVTILLGCPGLLLYLARRPVDA